MHNICDISGATKQKKRPNPSDDNIDQQGHVGGDVDNDGAGVEDGADTSDKDTGYTDDLMLLHKELEKEKPTKKVVKSLMLMLMLMSKTFSGHRAWILNKCSLVSDILNMFPPLSTPKYVSIQLSN